MEANEREIRERVVAQFLENPNASGRSIAKLLGLHHQMVNRVIKRFKESQTVERKSGTGMYQHASNREMRLKIIRSFKQNPGLSDRDRAKRYGTSKDTVRKIRIKAGYKSYRVIKHPNRADKQSLVAKKRARLLYDEVLTKFEGCIIMDDETYVKCDFKQIPGKKFYVSTIRGNVPNKYKYVLQDKFAKKFLIWQGICSCGLKSKIFVTSSTMNKEVYMKECLQKRLLPMIQLHTHPVIFWPDLASCHYAKDTQIWYETNQVEYIPKKWNPPNCPDLRPIEIFWAIVKQKLLKSGGTTTTAEKMRQKWKKHADTVDKELVQRLMSSIKRKTRRFIRE